MPSLLHPVPETSGLTGQQLAPLASVHHATCAARLACSGRRAWTRGRGHIPLPTALNMCAAAGAPQFRQLVKAIRRRRLGWCLGCQTCLRLGSCFVLKCWLG
eukprot:364640-Chlamydomonas_euryale.AAC.17